MYDGFEAEGLRDGVDGDIVMSGPDAACGEEGVVLFCEVLDG